ncbi:isocitrate lyase/phosphoenolpyruvate mutase family protein [Actinacidiphila sp. bgisy160]|uniref:isocitrate lyase/phosphoenolpyruvate mutase family protein n=1 Tax=Actinacidiphila sp. bgisy160 TaxID=3413796 RepID=UPI003D71642C
MALDTREGVPVMPKAWDGLSGLMPADAGSEAIATSSAALAISLGRLDGRHEVAREEHLGRRGCSAGPGCPSRAIPRTGMATGAGRRREGGQGADRAGRRDADRAAMLLLPPTAPPRWWQTSVRIEITDPEGSRFRDRRQARDAAAGPGGREARRGSPEPQGRLHCSA